MDFEGLSLKQIKALTPAYTKRLLIFIQDAMPVRLREIHFVKQPFIFNMVWTLFKPFVREKLKKRVWCFLKEICNKDFKRFFFCRCFSMVMTWRSSTSTSQLNVCLRTTAELYRKSITQEENGIRASKTINNILSTGQLSVSKMKLLTSSSFEYKFFVPPQDVNKKKTFSRWFMILCKEKKTFCFIITQRYLKGNFITKGKTKK